MYIFLFFLNINNLATSITEEQHLLQEKEKMKMEQMKEEDRIMYFEYELHASMTQLQAEYYQRRQIEILGKKM